MADWLVYDGEDIGRIYEVHAPTSPEIAWFWSLRLMGPARGRVRCDGNAATLGQAKADFVESLTAFRVFEPQS